MTDAENAAQRALDIINNLGGVVSEFRDNWLAVQAYSAVYENGGDQRQTIVNAIDDSLSIDTCQTLLSSFNDDIQYLYNNPVGNLRFAKDDVSFFRNGSRDIEIVINSGYSSKLRLANLICVIYQVRCNLDHGHKELTTDRSKKLFEICNRIILNVIEALVPLTKAG